MGAYFRGRVCPYNKEVDCNMFNADDCSQCGWNPDVTEKRKEYFEKNKLKYGYWEVKNNARLESDS